MADIKTSISSVAPWHGVMDSRGFVYMANGVDVPQCLPGADASTRKWGIAAPTASSTVAASAGGSLTGTYTYYHAYFNTNAGTVSNPSPISPEVSGTSVDFRLKFSSSASPADGQITHIRIFRNTDGQALTYYKVTDVSATVKSYLDGNTDATISVNAVMETDHDPPPSTCPFVAYYKNRVIMFGSRVESTGTANVTSASTAVTGSGTSWTASHEGQTFVIPGKPGQYTISTVNSATGLTLSTAWTASTTTGNSYNIYPANNRNLLTWSKAGETEYFPAANRNQVFASDNDEPTGIAVIQGMIFLFKERHVYRFFFENDPNPITGDGAVHTAATGRGLTNQRCIANTGNEAYILDRLGIYRYQGYSQGEPVDPGINRLIRPSPEAVADRVNWAQKQWFHACWDRKRDRVLVFCALGTDTYPKNAFAIERTTLRSSIEAYPMGITASINAEDDKGIERTWLGDENGQIWALGVTKARDCAPSSSNTTLSSTVTAYSGTVLTDSAATFYTTGDGLVGVPVYLPASSEFVTVQSNTGTALTLKAAPGTTPAVGASYIVGAIEAILQSTKFPLRNAAEKKAVKTLLLFFEPETSATFKLEAFYDFSATAHSKFQPKPTKKDGVTYPSTVRTDGKITVHVDEATGVAEVPIGEKNAHYVQFKLTFADVDKKPELLGFDFVWRDEPGSKPRGG